LLAPVPFVGSASRPGPVVARRRSCRSRSSSGAVLLFMPLRCSHRGVRFPDSRVPIVRSSFWEHTCPPRDPPLDNPALKFIRSSSSFLAHSFPCFELMKSYLTVTRPVPEPISSSAVISYNLTCDQRVAATTQHESLSRRSGELRRCSKISRARSSGCWAQPRPSSPLASVCRSEWLSNQARLNRTLACLLPDRPGHPPPPPPPPPPRPCRCQGERRSRPAADGS